MRLNIEINNNKINNLVLNEVYIGDVKPYNVFNYEINIEEQREFQRSSGVIIGTPSGSNAWISSAGGKILNLEEENFQYVSRELYKGRLTPSYKLEKGILDKTKKIEITCKSNGILVIDSILPEYNLNIGDKIRISADKSSLKYIFFD